MNISVNAHITVKNNDRSTDIVDTFNFEIDALLNVGDVITLTPDGRCDEVTIKVGYVDFSIQHNHISLIGEIVDSFKVKLDKMIVASNNAKTRRMTPPSL